MRLLTEVSLTSCSAGGDDSLQEPHDTGVHTHTALLQSTVDELLVHVLARETVQRTTVLQHRHWEI